MYGLRNDPYAQVVGRLQVSFTRIHEIDQRSPFGALPRPTSGRPCVVAVWTWHDAAVRGASDEGGSGDQRATVLALHHGYRVPGGEERAAEALADLAEGRLGERVAWVRRDSSELSAAQAARGLVAGGTGSSQITEALLATGADLVHAHNLFPTFGPSALEAARRGGAAVVVHLHNYRLVCAVATNVRDGQDCTECKRGWPTPGVKHRCRGSLPEAMAYAAALPRWQQAVLELADTIIVPSVAARTRLYDLGLALPADRVHVIGGVASGVADHSTASSGRYALAVTRLAPEKDLRTAIDASRRAGLPLVVAGDGPEREALEAYAGPPPAAPTRSAGATPRAAAARTPSDTTTARPHSGASSGAAPGPERRQPASDRRDAKTRPPGGTERRRPAVPPPPREFPVHHNPFLSAATPPASKPPPGAGRPIEIHPDRPQIAPPVLRPPALSKPAAAAEPAPEPPVVDEAPRVPASPMPAAQAAAAASADGPLDADGAAALLGPDVMRLLSRPPTVRGTTIFLGRCSDEALVALRAGARVGLATSVAHETFGLSALESMSAAVPTVGSAVGALTELLGFDQVTAPGNPEALATLIGRVAGNDAAGLAAAHRASAAAAPALVADRLAAAYAAARESLAGRRTYG